MKRGFQCKTEKDKDLFSKNKSRGDGLNPICKECCRENSKKRYIENKEKINASSKVYYEANKEKINAHINANRKANPEKIKSYYKNFYIKNKEKINLATKTYSRANPEKIKALYKAYYGTYPEKTFANKLKNRYSLTLKDYYALLEHQNGVCAICGEICITQERLSVDHDHLTGKVRGLLCRRCNLGLGHFQDSFEIISRAAEYLKSHKEA